MPAEGIPWDPTIGMRFLRVTGFPAGVVVVDAGSGVDLLIAHLREFGGGYPIDDDHENENFLPQCLKDFTDGPAKSTQHLCRRLSLVRTPAESLREKPVP